MKKQNIIHISLLIVILLQHLRMPQPVAAQRPVNCETRGVWLNRPAFATATARSTTLQNAQRANLNTLFVLVPSIVDANGVYHNGWTNHQAFVQLLKAAKQRGFQVHGWVANYYRKPGGVDYRYNQEWNHQANWALALLKKYPQLSGIHFDYIRYTRYPGAQDQAQDKTAAVSKTVKTTFSKIKAKYPNKSLTAAVFNIDPNWMTPGAFMPAWFKRWETNHPNNHAYDDLRNPKAVYGPRGFRVSQDSVTWLNNKYIDAVMPMIYTANLNAWKRRIPLWKSFVGGDDFSKVWFGIGWFYQGSYTLTWPDGSNYAIGNSFLPHNPGAAADAIIKQIHYARKQGMKGFVIFELGGPSVGATRDRILADKLGKGPFSQKAPSCLGGSAPSREETTDSPQKNEENIYLPIIR
jgi:hypothetical protein